MLGLLLAGGYASIIWRSVGVGCRHCDGVPGRGCLGVNQRGMK